MSTIRFWSNKEEPYGIFSNFAATPIVMEGDTYPTVEHYFQSMKASNAKDWKYVLEAATPKETKKRGREIPMREDWENVKCTIMLKALEAKAYQCSKFREVLLSTGDAELVEDSPFDSYWGCGRDGEGRNMLGELLVDVRTMLRERGDTE